MKFYTKKKRVPSITIVSLIDILVILLIFFIVTTSFRTQDPQMEINLPEAKTAEAAPSDSKPLVLDVKDADNITLDNQPVTADVLAVKLREALSADPQRTLQLRADQEAPFGVVVTVLDALREAGVKNIPALTQPKK